MKGIGSGLEVYQRMWQDNRRDTLDALTSNLHKLRVVAAHVCCCEDHDFSLFQFEALEILSVWQALGIAIDIPPENQDGRNFLIFARQICEKIEHQLVKSDLKKHPSALPYVVLEWSN